MENVKLLRKVRKVARQQADRADRDNNQIESVHSYYYALNRDLDDLDMNGFINNSCGEGSFKWLFKFYFIFYN